MSLYLYNHFYNTCFKAIVLMFTDIIRNTFVLVCVIVWGPFLKWLWEAVLAWFWSWGQCSKCDRWGFIKRIQPSTLNFFWLLVLTRLAWILDNPPTWPPECWDYEHVPPCLVEIKFLYPLLSSRKFALLCSVNTGICGVDFFTFFFLNWCHFSAVFCFQELEIVIGDEHISFTTSKIGSLIDVNQSK